MEQPGPQFFYSNFDPGPFFSEGKSDTVSPVTNWGLNCGPWFKQGEWFFPGYLGTGVSPVINRGNSVYPQYQVILASPGENLTPVIPYCHDKMVKMIQYPVA